MKRFFTSIWKGVKKPFVAIGKGCKRSHAFLKREMHGISTLVKMQLKERLNLKGQRFRSKATIFKGVYGVAKFALAVGLCYLIMFLCRHLGLFSLIFEIPVNVIALLFGVMLLLQTISDTLYLTKTLFYAKDNPILLVFPCKHTIIYISKLIVTYLYDLIRSMSFLVPLFVAFGILSKFPAYYYPWMLLMFVFICMVPILLGAILAIPAMYIYGFIKAHKEVFVGLVIIAAGVFALGLVRAIQVIPSNIDLVASWGKIFWKVQDILNWFTKHFNYIYELTCMITGRKINLIHHAFTWQTPIAFAQLIVVIIVFGVVGFFTTKPLFYTMVSKQFEFKRKLNKEKENKALDKRVSIVKTEMGLSFRNTSKLFAALSMMIAMPIAVLLLNKVFAAMDTRLLGNSLSIAFNVLIILLLALSSNAYAASAFSRDGRSSYLIKVQPSRYQPLLLVKLLFNTIFMTIAFIATTVVLAKWSSLSVGSAIIIMVGCYALYLAHLLYSAQLDLMNPKVELYATINDDASNPNEVKSTFVAFAGAFLTFAMLLFLLIEKSGWVTYFKLMLLALVIFAIRTYLFNNNVKLYYMERDI